MYGEMRTVFGCSQLMQHQIQECHGQFNWLHPKTVRISLYMYERKICETLEIIKLKTINKMDDTYTDLNRDNGDYVTTNSWKFFKLLQFHENILSVPGYFYFVAQHFSQKICFSNNKKFQINLNFVVVAETNFLIKKIICKKSK